MLQVTSSNISCTVRQVYFVSSHRPEEIIGAIKEHIPLYNGGKRAFIFSDRIRDNYGKSGGELLVEFIRDEELGTITESPIYKNGNYRAPGADLRIWIFLPDNEKVRNWKPKKGKVS